MIYFIQLVVNNKNCYFKNNVDYITQLLTQKILKTEVFSHPRSLNKKQQIQLQKYLNKVKNGYPVDYILGQIEFGEHSFFVKEGVFIPRWETEWWLTEIVKAKKLVPNIFSESFNTALNSTDLVAEIACGSGVIGLSLAKHFKKVSACDINPKAVQLSKKNQLKLGFNNYNVYKSNLFKNPKFKKSIDADWILIANLPYVPLIDYENRELNNILFEPPEAIFSGDTGLDLFRETLDQIAFLPPKLAFFELDPRNIVKAEKLAQKMFSQTSVYNDLDGLKRLLVCQI